MRFLNHPLKVLIVVVVVSFSYLLITGNLWQRWQLAQSETELKSRISDLKDETKNIEFQIEKAKGLSYVERQATDTLSLVRDGDLIFIFND